MEPLKLRSPADAPRQWHNHLPAAIAGSAAYASLGAGLRATLQGLADACHEDREGNLIGAKGSARLHAQIGCSRGTFFRHVRRLESLGLVVCLARGGVYEGVCEGNAYGIPAAVGSLEHRRVARRVQRMAPVEGRRDPGGRQTLCPQTLRPGEQIGVWAESPASECPVKGALPGRPPPSQSETDPVSKRDGPRLKVRRTPSQSETQHHHGFNGAHAHGAARSKKRRGFGNVKVSDLKDTRRLLELWAVAATRGIVQRSEEGLLQFVAAAEHALRIERRERGGADPVRNVCGLFVGIITNEQRLPVSAKDEDRANERLKRYRYGAELPRDCEKE